MPPPSVGEASDNEVMAGVQAGDLARLGLLFERHHRGLFQYFLHLTGRREASEDLVQEVFVRVLKYRHTFQSDRPFGAWLYQVARRAHLDGIRRGRAATAVGDDGWLLELPSQDASADEQVRQQQELDLLRRAFAELPAEKRELLVLARFEERRYDEIAAVLACEVNTVKTRVFRAVRELGQAYRRLSGDTAARGGAA